MLCGKGFLAKCSGPHRSVEFAEEIVVCARFLGSCSVCAAPRRFAKYTVLRAGFWAKCRSAGSRFRSTSAPNMPGNSSNQSHYVPSAVVKCKFPLSELCGEATYWGGPCGAHVFEGFLGLENEPVKSVKMKVETRSGILWKLPHEFALCSAAHDFGLLSGSLLCFIVWNPIRKKNVKPNKRAVSTKSTRIAIILNPPAGPLRCFDLLQTF